MTKLPVEINLSQRGHGQVIIGGHDVSDCVEGISYQVSASGRNEMAIRLVPLRSALNLEGVHVAVESATRALLIELGWTPPTPEPSGVETITRKVTK